MKRLYAVTVSMRPNPGIPSYTDETVTVPAYTAEDAYFQVTKCPESYGIWGDQVRVTDIKPVAEGVAA